MTFLRADLQRPVRFPCGGSTSWVVLKRSYTTPTDAPDLLSHLVNQINGVFASHWLPDFPSPGNDEGFGYFGSDDKF